MIKLIFISLIFIGCISQLKKTSVVLKTPVINTIQKFKGSKIDPLTGDWGAGQQLIDSSQGKSEAIAFKQSNGVAIIIGIGGWGHFFGFESDLPCLNKILKDKSIRKLKMPGFYDVLSGVAQRKYQKSATEFSFFFNQEMNKEEEIGCQFNSEHDLQKTLLYFDRM